MDAAKALADLTEISTQIEAAVIATRSGEVVASTIADETRAGRFARAADQLLAAAGEPVQLEAALGDASVFVVREGDRLIAAATGADPTVGLVFYDLKSALRSSAEAPAEEAKPTPKPPPPPRSKPAPKQAETEAPAEETPKPKRAPRSKPAPKPEETDGAA